VHFLGDVTQPLHDEALALGGNNIIPPDSNMTAVFEKRHTQRLETMKD
jgi:hypothetical protein